MRIRQTMRHLAARAALEMPIVSSKVRQKLVDLHTRVFLERAPGESREERRDHLDAFFDASMDIYLAALKEGYTEAGAREVTHILANVEFHRMGWVEMMEFPPHELDENLARYGGFFEDHDITVTAPLGEFEPDQRPEAPATPEALEEAKAEHAEAGYGDDLYVEDEEGNLTTASPKDPETA